MKKLILSAALALTVSAQAADISASYVRDNELGKNGSQLQVTAGSLFGVSPVFGITHVNNFYNRYSVGAAYTFTKVGPASLAVTGSAVYQDTMVKSNGYGLTAGAKVSVPVSNSIDLVGKVDYFVGQKRVNRFDGATSSVGVNFKF